MTERQKRHPLVLECKEGVAPMSMRSYSCRRPIAKLLPTEKRDLVWPQRVACGYINTNYIILYSIISKHVVLQYSVLVVYFIIEGSLNSKLPTIWRVEKQMRQAVKSASTPNYETTHFRFLFKFHQSNHIVFK